MTIGTHMWRNSQSRTTDMCAFIMSVQYCIEDVLHVACVRWLKLSYRETLKLWRYLDWIRRKRDLLTHGKNQTRFFFQLIDKTIYMVIGCVRKFCRHFFWTNFRQIQWNKDPWLILIEITTLSTWITVQFSSETDVERWDRSNEMFSINVYCIF